MLPRKRLADGRREELLDGVMEIISARGYTDVRLSDLAAELCCSTQSLYKIAPSKDSLIHMAIARWGDRTLDNLEDRLTRIPGPADQARDYFQAGAHSLRPLSPKFREDVERFESSRLLWKTIADRWIDRFVQLLDAAIEAGQIRPINTRFLAHVLQQTGFVTRNEPVLQSAGLTAEHAVLEIDSLIWEGIRPSRASGAGGDSQQSAAAGAARKTARRADGAPSRKGKQ